jgi:hypothetical protein
MHHLPPEASDVDRRVKAVTQNVAQVRSDER